jgi:hypothetical protein
MKYAAPLFNCQTGTGQIIIIITEIAKIIGGKIIGGKIIGGKIIARVAKIIDVNIIDVKIIAKIAQSIAAVGPIQILM